MTGDLARVDEEGYIYITGRKKFVFKKSGVAVNPYYIEQTARGLSEVDEAIVYRIPNKAKGNLIGISLVISKTAHSELTIEKVKNHLQANLNKFLWPDEYKFVDKIKQTSSGKKIRSIS